MRRVTGNSIGGYPGHEPVSVFYVEMRLCVYPRQAARDYRSEQGSFSRVWTADSGCWCVAAAGVAEAAFVGEGHEVGDRHDGEDARAIPDGHRPGTRLTGPRERGGSDGVG
jgi:hypothetical protein